jgi:translocation protein SEC63
LPRYFSEICSIPKLTYSLIDLENTAPRIKSDFKPQHADLVEAQKRKRLRKERRIKRIITVIVGYIVMAWMVYLILVTARSTTKMYDPYDILGVSRVCSEAPRRIC